MEYTITKTKWQHGDISEEFVERFEGTPEEIIELLKLTNGMNECVMRGKIGEFVQLNANNITVGDKKVNSDIFTIDDMEEFFKGKMAVNCKTEKLAEEFLNKLYYKYDMCWMNKTDLMETKWQTYEKDTCYDCETKKELTYGDIDFYKTEGYEIKEFKGW